MANRVVVIDYKMGNVHSVLKKLRRLKVETLVSADADEIRRAEKLLLPGVGHFGKAMSCLQENHLVEALQEAVLERRAPILGICLGMQLMTRHSQEGEVAGLGWIDAEVRRFQPQNQVKFKVPHTGWNRVHSLRPNPLFASIEPQSEFYFVHSYKVCLQDPSLGLAETDYEMPFCSAFQSDNIYGVQFHPEKSHDVGEQMLANFVSL